MQDYISIFLYLSYINIFKYEKATTILNHVELYVWHKGSKWSTM